MPLGGAIVAYGASGPAVAGGSSKHALTFNDANVTGNYTVLHDLQNRFGSIFPERLKDVFQGVRRKHRIDIIAAKTPIASQEA